MMFSHKTAPACALLVVMSMMTTSSAFVANPGFRHDPFAVPGKTQVPFHRAIDDTSLNVGMSFPLNIPPMTEQQQEDKNYDEYYRQLNRRSRSQNWQWATDHRTGTVAVAALAVEGAQQAANAKRIFVAKRVMAAMILLVSVKRLMLAGPAVASALSGIGYLYKAFPMQSAMVTCGMNSGLADLISQVKGGLKNSDGVFKLELRKTLSCSTYGALICGALGSLFYGKLLPVIFGTSGGVSTIIGQSLADNFVAAPFVWLPPAYLFKAAFLNYSFGEALRSYWKDITQAKLLVKYWSVWIPAQLLNFAVVPRHLRVPFVATVGFCWAMVLSSLTAPKKEATA